MATPDDVQESQRDDLEELQRLDSLSIDESMRSQARHDARVDCANDLHQFIVWLSRRNATNEEITAQLYVYINRWEST